MNAYPFSVFKRTDRPCYLVAFKDANDKYLPPLSTGNGKVLQKDAKMGGMSTLADITLEKLGYDNIGIAFSDAVL